MQSHHFVIELLIHLFSHPFNERVLHLYSCPGLNVEDTAVTALPSKSRKQKPAVNAERVEADEENKEE